MALIVKGKGTRLIQAPQKEVRAALRKSGGVAVFGVSVDSEAKEVKVVVKDVQRDSISRGIVHLTLQEVQDNDIIRIAVPVHFVGTPESVVKKRSSLMTPMVTLEIYAKPADIPDSLTVNVSELGDNDKIVVSQVALPAGVETHLPPDALVATTTPLRAVSLEVPGTEAAAGEAAEGEAAEGGAGEGEAAEGEAKEGEQAAAKDEK